MKLATWYLGILAAAWTMVLAPVRAHADPITYHFTGSGDGVTMSGTLTTSATANGDGSYTIIGITGTYSGPGASGSITGLIASGEFEGNDNKLFVTSPGVPGSGPYFDSFGVSFGVQGPVAENLAYISNYVIENASSDLYVLSPFALTAAPSAVPEPASILSACTGGVILAGFAWRRRRRRARAVIDV